MDFGELSVRVRAAMGGTVVEFRGRPAFFERHVAPLVDALGRHAGTREEAAAGAGRRYYTPESPQQFHEYAASVGARAATVDQRIVAFAFYCWNYEKREEVDAAEVEAFFRTILEEPPEDLNQRLSSLSTAKRFLTAGTTDTRWRLTAKGINYVKNRLLSFGPDEMRA